MADKSADENEFGIACSLNILSAEEAVKGIAIILSVNGITSDFNKLFKDHKTKHQHLFELSLLNQIQIEKMVTNFKIKDTITQIDSLPDDIRQTVIDRFPKFYSNSLSLLELYDNRIDIQESKQWWEKANTEKNRGFYVDLYSNKWHDPRAATKEKYLNERRHTDSIIKVADLIMDIVKLPEIISELKNFR